jgi:hypothetical protein
MTTTRRSSLLLSTLLSTFALSALPGCDAGEHEPDTLRSVTLSDSWGEHDPTHFPEVNSCDDYWNTRCAELSSAQCSYLRSRYTCSSAMQGPGVVITDHFGDELDASAEVWRVHVRGDAGFSDGFATPKQACASIANASRAGLCRSMSEIALVAVEQHALAPKGGIAPLVPLDAIGDELPSFEGNLGFELLEPLDWTVPVLDIEARAALAEYFVAEDEIMLLAGPEGSVTVSSKDIVMVRDVRCTMDKLDLDVDVDVK